MGDPLPTIRQTEIRTRLYARFLAALLLLIALYFILRNQHQPSDLFTNQGALIWDDVAYVDEKGEAHLKEWRALELQKKMEALAQAEQYALIAIRDRWYECYSCPNKTYYLREGMIWKYGVTTRGQSGRYTTVWLYQMQLAYQIQFKGTYQECLLEEKRKIILYPLHPDNLARLPTERLARPPGNKNDN